MKFCYNTNFTPPKHSERSRSALQNGSIFLGLFGKGEKLCFITEEIWYTDLADCSNWGFAGILGSD